MTGCLSSYNRVGVVVNYVTTKIMISVNYGIKVLKMWQNYINLFDIIKKLYLYGDSVLLTKRGTNFHNNLFFRGNNSIKIIECRTGSRISKGMHTTGYAFLYLHYK